MNSKAQKNGMTGHVGECYSHGLSQHTIICRIRCVLQAACTRLATGSTARWTGRPLMQDSRSMQSHRNIGSVLESGSAIARVAGQSWKCVLLAEDAEWRRLPTKKPALIAAPNVTKSQHHTSIYRPSLISHPSCPGPRLAGHTSTSAATPLACALAGG